MARIINLLAIAAIAVAPFFSTASASAVGVSRRDAHAEIAKRLAAASGGSANITRRAAKRCPAKSTSSKTSTTAKSTSTHKATSTSKPKPKVTVADAPPPPPKANNPAPNGSKVCLAYTGGGDLSSFKTSKTSRVYNWTPVCQQETRDAGLKCINSFWGPKNEGQWLSLLTRGYGDVAVGANEVNQPGEAQMSVGEGVSLWKAQMEPLLSRGYALGSHSVSNAPSGTTWLQQFASECPECWDQVTWINAHYYGIDAQEMISYIEGLRAALPGNKRVMITEFACQDFSGNNQPCPSIPGFMSTITKWADSTEWIDYYCWFQVQDAANIGGGVDGGNALMNSNGHPSALGEQYIN